MNEDRRHEGLDFRTPSSPYAPSPREWTSCAGEPEYPGHWEGRRIRSDGQMKLRGEQLFVSVASGGELVGLLEVQDAIWRLCYHAGASCASWTCVERRRGSCRLRRPRTDRKESGSPVEWRIAQTPQESYT